ncbi:MAG: hypothetical protein Q8O40_16810 [Chloroflexota bacterium]|nr:hypothetical protein [Chloroflexota bacterium]
MANKKKKGLLTLGLLLLLAATVSAAVWAATAGAGGMTITVAAGEGVGGGRVADVNHMSASASGVTGKAATQIQGVALEKITLASTNYSNKLWVEFMLVDPQNIGKALNNPNSFIKAQLYYRDPNQESPGDCTTETGRLSIIDPVDGAKWICPDTGDEAYKYITRNRAVGSLRSSKDGQSFFYVIGQITVPGGVAQGQQQIGLSNLTWWVDVKKR